MCNRINLMTYHIFISHVLIIHIYAYWINDFGFLISILKNIGRSFENANDGEMAGDE